LHRRNLQGPPSVDLRKGTSLTDPEGLLNTYRAIVIHEEDKINEAAFKNLIRSAVELNHKIRTKTKYPVPEILNPLNFIY